jgi:hypothetical protein
MTGSIVNEFDPSSVRPLMVGLDFGLGAVGQGAMGRRPALAFNAR